MRTTDIILAELVFGINMKYTEVQGRLDKLDLVILNPRLSIKSIYHVVADAKEKHWERDGRDPSTIYVSRDDYYDLVKVSEPYYVPHRHNIRTLFGMRIEVSNYLDRGQVFPLY
jgi:hypothetical protein